MQQPAFFSIESHDSHTMYRLSSILNAPLSLRSLPLSSLHSLTVWDNPLGSAGIAALCMRGLSANRTLTHLSLGKLASENRENMDDALTALSFVFSSASSSSECMPLSSFVFDISDSTHESVSSIAKFGSALARHSYLKSLHLSGFQSSLCEYLLRPLCYNKTLIDLQFPSMKATNAAPAFGEAAELLRVNQSLVSFRIGSSSMFDDAPIHDSLHIITAGILRNQVCVALLLG